MVDHGSRVHGQVIFREHLEDYGNKIVILSWTWGSKNHMKIVLDTTAIRPRARAQTLSMFYTLRSV
jgi:hypothetical protein